MAETATINTDTATDQGPVIESREDLDKALKQMGVLDARIRKRKSERDDEVRAIDARIGRLIQKDQVNYDFTLKACERYAAEHRDELLAGQKTKTAKLVHGEISYSAGRETVDLAEGVDEAKVIADLKKKDLDACVTVKESLNRSVIKAMWDTVSKSVKGLVLKTGAESVKIKPNPVS